MMEGAMSHQSTRGPSKTSGALIKVTVYLNVTKAVILVASFMITGMGRREGYGSVSTGLVAFNLFHNSEFMGVKRQGRSRRRGVGGGVVEFSKVPV